MNLIVGDQKIPFLDRLKKWLALSDSILNQKEMIETIDPETRIKIETAELDFDAEFNRIYASIPSVYFEDIILPSGVEPYTVKYQVDNEDLTGSILIFELQAEDQEIELEVIIESGNQKEKFYILKMADYGKKTTKKRQN